MKALNYKKVMCGYLLFAGHLLLAVASVLLCVFFFFLASEKEYARIEEKTEVCEQIYREQNHIVDGFDEVFSLYRSFDLVEGVNPDFLMRSLVARKLEVASMVRRIPQEEVEIPMHLLNRMEDLLRVRDSISSMQKTEQTVKDDLIRCCGESRSITRKMRVGKLLYSK